MSKIDIDGLSKRYGEFLAVEDISLSVREGELLCLLGPSGCGKSTTLRMIAGLETPSDGTITFGNEDVTDTPPYHRDCSMVFQHWALFPQKTVVENVAFGLKMKGVGKSERRNRALETLETLEIREFADQKPQSLSGGQQQRVALARSIVVDSSILLFDEPLSNLDKRLREEMQIEIKSIHDRLDKTMVYVTHDQNEAFTLADRIGILNEGRLVQVGDPWEIYNNPKNQFIEEFLGETNIVDSAIDKVSEDEVLITTGLGYSVHVPASKLRNSVNSGDPITTSIRPEAVTIHTDLSTGQEESSLEQMRTDGSKQALRGTVDNVLYRGSTIRYYLVINEEHIFVDVNVSNAHDLSSGDDVGVTIDTDELLFFNDGRRLTNER